MNLPIKKGRASPRLLVIASLIHGFALAMSFSIYPLQIVGITPLTQFFWQAGLIVAALSAVVLLLIVLWYAWLTACRLCSIVLLIVALSIVAGYVTLWFHFYNIMLRMP